jgi:hypothetical protein
MYRSNGREKNPEDRIRRNAETYVIDNAEWDGVVHGFDLPSDMDWGYRTTTWWEKWRRSPQSMLMTETDWEFLLETAILHNIFYNPSARTGTVSLVQVAAELRQRVGKFGATYEDRKKLRMTISVPQTERNEDELIEEEASRAIDYAERLNQKAAAQKKK